MNTRRALALAALLALGGIATAPSIAASPEVTVFAAPNGHAAPAGTACRDSAGDRIHLAQGMPIDCCKGHKGICGCRAGKIVCCDGTVSKDPNCTCHADWGEEN